MYAKEKVQQSLKCLGELAEVFNRNRDLRNRFVLTGGWAPYFITKERFEHSGSVDIDLILSNSILIAYTKVADVMKNVLGYEQTAPFEFTKKVNDIVMQVHFLCEPESLEKLPEDRFLFKMQKGVSAFIIDGCSIVFEDCFKENIGASYILISGLVSTISLKIRAFYNRAKDKDAYDLFVLLKYGKENLEDAVSEMDKWKGNKFVQESLQKLKNIIKESEEKIPRAAASYLYPDDPDAFKQHVEEIKSFFSGIVKKI